MSEKNGFERGTIKYIARYLQGKLISFEGMESDRGITPTDIDGFTDYKGNAALIQELKVFGAPFEYGQRTALENFVKTYKQAGKVACAVLYEHVAPPPEILEETSEYWILKIDKKKNIIIAKDKFVSKYFSSDDTTEWITPPQFSISVNQLRIYFEEEWKKRGIEL